MRSSGYWWPPHQGPKKIILSANPDTGPFYGKAGFLRMNTAVAIWTTRPARSSQGC